MKKIIVLFAILTAFFGCTKFIPNNETSVQLKKNIGGLSYIPNFKYSQLRDNSPSDNKITNAGAALGRVLFYDTRLSLHNNVACASCHKQADAFADGTALSTGFDGGLTSRNSMSLTNLANADKLFWDGRTSTLEQLALEPISHPVEMGFENLEILPKKLALTNYYPELFNAAFGTTAITKEKIANALAQFLRAMTSYRAPVDFTNLPNSSWLNNVPEFNASENRGLQIFSNSGCPNCHAGPNFGGTTFENIGLDVSYSDPGQGSKGSAKEGFFKVPSLRNIELTAPYMHDGRFASLQEVLKHYSNNIQPHPNLAPILTNASWNNPNDHSPIHFNFSDQNINDLEAFLKTLTDREMLKDERFSDPFVR